ncbi:MAG: S53 family peptidase [Candidatus Pacebacteria bacterium]|nr:S53 family peptidase [Candidatus Paceibacterota bacterium]
MKRNTRCAMLVARQAIGAAVLIAVNFGTFGVAHASTIPSLDVFTARPPIHVLAGSTAGPAGLSPSLVKKAYGLPSTGGKGTIAIVAAYDHPNIANDLAAFDKAFGIASCTIANKCLEIHPMNATAKDDSGWAMETALDTEWSHVIAPNAKILVVEAASDSGTNLLKAVDYARSRSDVVAVSMSWGGDEFAGETALDKHFMASTSIAFFASSGDDGAGASWPAASPFVISVGGTSLVLDSKGALSSEKAWPGSGGGVSAFENEPSYQNTYSILRADGKRAIPDVAFAADPQHGFSVYHAPDSASAKSTSKTASNGTSNASAKNWYVVGGTSAGAPQWAAIADLAFAAKDPISLSKLYADKASATYAKYFRDITSGNNGDCGYFCVARKHYDYVTGLGSPMTDKF